MSDRKRDFLIVVTCLVTSVAVAFWFSQTRHEESSKKPAGAQIQRESADHLQDLIVGSLDDAGINPAPPAAPAKKTPPHVAQLMHDAPGVIGHDPATMIYGYHGTGCGFKNYYLIVYIHCTMLVQPGTARQWDISLNKNLASLAFIVADLMSKACAALGFGIWSTICIFVAAYFVNEFRWAADAARNNHQCLRIQTDYFPAGNPVPTNWRFDSYGKWSVWQGTKPFLKEVMPTSCQMHTKNPCSPVWICL